MILAHLSQIYQYQCCADMEIFYIKNTVQKEDGPIGPVCKNSSS